MKKHTQGPWYFVTEDVPQHNADNYQVYKVGYADEGKLDYSNSDPFQELCEVIDIENARLIAAAPELLEALDTIVSDAELFLSGDMDLDSGEVFEGIAKLARAAIAKATE